MELAMKGAALNSTVTWVRKELGEEVLREVFAAMPANFATQYEKALAFSWVPIPVQDAFQRALAAKAWPNDRAKTIQSMRRLGMYVAADNLSTLYKVVLAFTSPDSLLAMLPRLWSTYFSGVEVADVKKQDRAASFVVRHVGYYMLGAHAAGWLEFAYRKVGSPDPAVQCVELEKGVDDAKDLHFTLRW
jgi:hypothetical protein